VYVHVHNKTSREAAGVCAHFCPVCRAITLLRVEQVSTVTTVNLIPIGKKKHINDELTCTGCGTVFRFPPSQVRPLPESHGLELHDLAAETSPWTIEALMARLDLESRLHEGTLSPAERRLMLAETIQSLEAAAERATQRATTRFTAFFAFLFIGSLVGSVILWCLALGAPSPSAIDLIVASAVTAGTIAIFVLLAIRMRRDAIAARRTFLLAPLVTALGPLEPTEQELRAVLADFRKSKVAAHIKADVLVRAVRAGAAPP